MMNSHIVTLIAFNEVIEFLKTEQCLDPPETCAEPFNATACYHALFGSVLRQKCPGKCGLCSEYP